MQMNIRKISKIRTDLNEHGDTRNNTDADEQKIRNIREIRTEQKPLNFQHNEEVHQTNPVDPFDRPGDWSLGDADRLQCHPHRHHDLE